MNEDAVVFVDLDLIGRDGLFDITSLFNFYHGRLIELIGAL